MRDVCRVAVVAGAGLLCAAGCAFKGDADAGDKPSAKAGEVWRPRAVALRIYPSTRFVEERGDKLLEARIELFDEMGDSVKAAGRVHFELHPVGEEGSAAIGERLYAWDIDLLTLDDHREYYDPIIRGYVFRLKIGNFDPARHSTRLTAVFTTIDGRRLDTRDRVQTAW